jgi:O-antigen/teichoic acid export membrane protein
VAQVTAPLLRYLDRYIVGALLSLAAVAYYTAPFDMMDRLWMISSSLALTLFPAFSALTGSGDVSRAQTLFCRSVRYLVLAQCPIVLVLTAYAGPILRLWLGPDFAEHSTLALQLLGLAWILGALAPVPASLLDGYGRPDLLPKLYLVALPLNTAFTWLFVQTMGLPGAALWVSIRALLQTATLVLMAGRLLGLRPARTVAALAHPIGTIWGTTLAIGLFASLPTTEPLRAALLVGLLAVFASGAWRWGLDQDDRRLLQALVQRAHP